MPEKLTERQKNVRQIPFRLHMNDKTLFMKLLSDHGLTFQTFSHYCMQAFLNADPAILKVIKDWKAMSDIPKDHLKLYTLSHRERAAIQKELDEMQKQEGETK